MIEVKKWLKREKKGERREEGKRAFWQTYNIFISMSSTLDIMIILFIEGYPKSKRNLVTNGLWVRRKREREREAEKKWSV